MQQLLTATCWMLLLGPIYGSQNEGSSTNPEANMNIVSHSLRKKTKRRNY